MYKTFPLILVLGILFLTQETIAKINPDIRQNMDEWEQHFKNSGNLKQLKKLRVAFETQASGKLGNFNSTDSTVLVLLKIYESYLGQLYPAMEKELKAKGEKENIKRLYDRITEERESVLSVIVGLCGRLQKETTPRICLVTQKYFAEKQFRNDFKTKLAPEFNFTDVTGKKGTLSDFRGVYVLLHFWSMYSMPCVEELKDLKKVKALYGHKLKIVSINTDPVETKWDRETLYNFIQTMNLNWTQIADGSSKHIFNLYHIHNYPTLYIIDPKGFAVNPGFRLGKELRGKRLFKTLARLLV